MNKKILVIILIFMLVTTFLVTSAKPPHDKKPPGQEKPDNPHKKNKDNETNNTINITFYIKAFRGLVDIQSPIMYQWGNWSEWWLIQNMNSFITGTFGGGCGNDSIGYYNITINNSAFVGEVYLDNGNIYNVSGRFNLTAFDGVVKIEGAWESFYGYITDYTNMSGTWFWRRCYGWFSNQ